MLWPHFSCWPSGREQRNLFVSQCIYASTGRSHNPGDGCFLFHVKPSLSKHHKSDLFFNSYLQGFYKGTYTWSSCWLGLPNTLPCDVEGQFTKKIILTANLCALVYNSLQPLCDIQQSIDPQRVGNTALHSVLIEWTRPVVLLNLTRFRIPRCPSDFRERIYLNQFWMSEMEMKQRLHSLVQGFSTFLSHFK